MIKKYGYFVSFSSLVDENVWLALCKYANDRDISPDYALEQLIEEHCTDDGGSRSSKR